jgi:hypothetical protein
LASALAFILSGLSYKASITWQVLTHRHIQFSYTFVKKLAVLSLSRFVSYYFVYALLVAALAMLLPTVFPNQNLLAPQFWVIFCFVAGVTLIAYTLVHLGVKQHPETGVMAIMGSIAVKMFLCLAFILIYSLKAKGIGLTFAFNFFSLYLLFTFFEIYCLLRNLRHQNK